MSLELFFINETLDELKKTYTQFRSGNGYRNNKAPDNITKEEIIKLILALYNIEFKKMEVTKAKNEFNEIANSINSNIKAN